MNPKSILSFFTGLMLAAVLVWFLSGCGGSAEPVSQAPEEPTATSVPPTPAGDPAAGEQLFVASCSSCHGPDAKGITGVGKDLTTGDFLPGMTDDDFVVFINTGRPSGDPANTTGIDMPPKGGNPALSDDQILDIIAYLRSIHD